MGTDLDRAQEIVQRRTRSFDWMKNNFYPEWEKVFKSYKCVRDPEKNPDGTDDTDGTSIGMPMTWAHIRRTVARGTAQIPNLKYHMKDTADAELVSRTLMYQWDRGVQRQQKRHFTQAALFGISIRPWHWANDEYTRTKRIDPMNPQITPEDLQLISDEYKVPTQYLAHPAVGSLVRARLLAKAGRGGLLPVKYEYRGYFGPRCDFLFIGDCYFQPNMDTLQSSQWFIVERRRNMAWIKRAIKAFPELAAGFQTMIDQFPQGTPRPTNMRDVQGLRERMLAAIGQEDKALTVGAEDTREWSVLEQHVPGQKAHMTYVGEMNVYIGDVPYPYDLDGKIAFTELVLIDDLLSGIGDSTARIIQGLQQLHDRQVNTRLGLVYNLLRPLIGTSNRELLENPSLVKRYSGFRMIPMRGPNDLWMQSEQAAMAAAATGLSDESSIMRLYQMATGESNMSSSANVDPQQNRTATGARILAYNQDVLTRDSTDMYNMSISADAEMMFLLNRSELAEPVEFDAARYNRTYSQEDDSLKAQWVRAEPAHFQQDGGEIVAEVGSTLADDDEGNVAKATNLFQAAMGNPQLFNTTKARDEYLIAMGKGRELAQWAAPPPSPPPPVEVKPSLSIQIKWELLSDTERQQIMAQIGVQEPPPGMPAATPPGMSGGPPQAGPGGPAGMLPPMPPEAALLASSAGAASHGHSPFEHPDPMQVQPS